jgi:hypothetical protein
VETFMQTFGFISQAPIFRLPRCRGLLRQLVQNFRILLQRPTPSTRSEFLNFIAEAYSVNSFRISEFHNFIAEAYTFQLIQNFRILLQRPTPSTCSELQNFRIQNFIAEAYSVNSFRIATESSRWRSSRWPQR